MPVKKKKCVKDDCESNNHKDFPLCRKHYIDENRDKIQTNTDGSKEKFCTNCAVFRDAGGFISQNGKPTSRCGMCLATTRRAEANREPRDRDYSAYEKTAKRKAARLQYREDNYEQHAKYYMKSRAKKIEKCVDTYLKNNREYAKRFRAEHPEYVEQQREKDKMNYSKILYGYIYEAEVKGIDWKLTDEYSLSLFDGECYYCGIKSDKELNGIDRINNAKPYEESNVVSSCSMCNYMKNSMDICTFIKRCIHIANYNVLTQKRHFPEKYFPEVFFNYVYVSYRNYLDRAKKNGIEFMINTTDFNEITDKDCYLCGKKNSGNHRNGIDRYDNNQGYTITNCRPCCNNCNIMKKEYEYLEFVTKCFSIAGVCYKKLDIYKDVKVMAQIQNMGRKKKKLNRRIKLNELNKQKRNRLMDPNYREKHAKELAENRKKKY